MLLALIAAAPGSIRAEKKAGTPEQPPVAITTQTAAALPDAYKLNMMIRTTLIALNQANQTGNYSVLRDLGTPQFQAMNSDARLGEIFAGLRRRNLDLSPLLFFDPQLARQPAIEPGGVLRMTGLIPTTPERIVFDMGFERVGDHWRLSAIVIDMQQAPEPAAAAPPDKAASPKVDKTNANAKAKAKAPQPAKSATPH